MKNIHYKDSFLGYSTWGKAPEYHPQILGLAEKSSFVQNTVAHSAFMFVTNKKDIKGNCQFYQTFFSSSPLKRYNKLKMCNCLAF
jgi:hypothetical protein